MPLRLGKTVLTFGRAALRLARPGTAEPPRARRDKGAEFRALHRPGDPFILPNAWDRGSARVLAGLGASAIGTSSAGFAFARGLPDGAHVTLDETLAQCADLAAAVDLPVSADLENGFAEAPDDLAATIRRAAEAGLAGASIEDTVLPGEGAYAFYLAVERIRAAASAARGLRRDFVLTARADGLRTGAYGLDEAIARAEAFASAGADCVHVPMLPDLATLAELCQRVRGPVSALAAGPLVMTPRPGFAAAGAARIGLGSGLARVAHAALIGSAREVLELGRFGSLAAAAAAGDVDALLDAGTPPRG